MDKLTEPVDAIQHALSEYAYRLDYAHLSPAVIHDTKLHIIDTLGALIAGFFGEPCRITRKLAVEMPSPNATIVGTYVKTTPEMAALVNGTAARYMELNDFYHRPPGSQGHPSDTLMPVLAAAEFAQVNGRSFITAVVLAYEVYQRMCDIFHNIASFDNTNLACLATALATGKLWALSPKELSHCISMAVVANVTLRQARLGHFKAVAAGHAGRAGIFAARAARAGMEGPHLPFEGKAGWCEHVARERLALGMLGDKEARFKILDARIKLRPAATGTLSSILAAEKIQIRDVRDVKQITVEVYKRCKERFLASEERYRNPDSREAADHSIPYVVAATLIDGTLTPRAFDDAHLWNPALRELLNKIEIVEREEFTKAYPAEHHTRVTVLTHDGRRLVGEAGGGDDDLAAPKNEAKVIEKFHRLTEEALGKRSIDGLLNCLWHLENLENISAIMPALRIA